MFFVFRCCSSPQIGKTKELNQNFRLETWTIWKRVNKFGRGVLVGKVNYRDKQVHMSWMSSVGFFFVLKYKQLETILESCLLKDAGVVSENT